MKALMCAHCHSEVLVTANVCRGCGAEVVRGASRRERLLTGVMFVIAAILFAVVAFRVVEVMRGTPPLSSPKAEDGFWFFAALIALIVIPYFMGTRVARVIWRSRIRFYRNYQHQ